MTNLHAIRILKETVHYILYIYIYYIFGAFTATTCLIIIKMVISKCYFSGEHISLSIIKKQQRCEHRIRKNQQIKSTVHDANYYMK